MHSNGSTEKGCKVFVTDDTRKSYSKSSMSVAGLVMIAPEQAIASNLSVQLDVLLDGTVVAVRVTSYKPGVSYNGSVDTNSKVPADGEKVERLASVQKSTSADEEH